MQQVLPLPEMIDVSTLPSIAVNEHALLPQGPGLYFVLEGSTVRYIGRAKDLKNRWEMHHRIWQYTLTAKSFRLAWISISNPMLLPVLERAYIRFFHPCDNYTAISFGERHEEPPEVSDDPTPQQEMSFQEAIEAVRTSFNELRKGQTFLDLQEPVGVSRARLSVFASGGMLKLADIEKIEEWCVLAAKKRGINDHS